MPETTDIIIKGGKKVKGSIRVNTSKNGTMGLLAASLINKGRTTLRNVPRIEELNRMIEIFRSIGVSMEFTDEHTLVIQPPKKLNLKALNEGSASKVRSIITTVGALIHWSNNMQIPHAGGCQMGARSIAAHRYALEDLGVKIITKENYYEIKHRGLKPAEEIVMYEAGDTPTISAMLGAALVPGQTTITFGTSNYQVQDVAFFLERLGVQIDGIGTTTMTVHGVKNIDVDIEHFVSEDPIEAMAFISIAATSNSHLTITHAPIDFLKLELKKLKAMGLKFKQSKSYLSDNGRTKLVDLEIRPSKLTALHDKLHPLPYPGINVDNLPFFVPIVTQAEGTTLIHDWMWENRAIYFTELNKLGANVNLADPHRVFITGPTKLKGTQLVCPPALRPSMTLLVAMIAADGVSVLRNTYMIHRGYENIVERLQSIGIDIAIM